MFLASLNLLIGAVCGSVILDERFQVLLRQIYQNDFDKEIPESTLRIATQYWQDYIKPTYKGPLDEEEFEATPYEVPLSGLTTLSETNNFKYGSWFMEQYIHRSDFYQSKSDTV